MNDQAREPILLRETAEGVVTLTLNRPKQRNALSMALMGELVTAFSDIGADTSVKVVVLRANGPGFCSGHDLKEMRANPREEIYRQIFERCARMMTAIVELPQPVIARVNGIATAAGCQLVATCDLAIASEEARFATPGVNIGLFCSTPMVALSRNVSRKHAMEMLLTGEMMGAAAAVRFGLINRAVPESELDQAVAELARKIASKSPLVLKIGKQAFYEQLEYGLKEAYEYTGAVMVRNMMADDAAEGIDAFLQKREPVWTGT